MSKPNPDDFDLDAFVDETLATTQPAQTLEPRVVADVTRMVGVTPPTTDAMPFSLETLIANLKTKVTAAEPTPCGFCGRETPADGCEDGWVYTENGVRMCAHQHQRLESRRLSNAMKLIGLDETKFAKGWDELEVTHESWRTARSIAGQLRVMRESGLNLFLWGALGRGKTHAGLLLIREALRLGMTAAHTQWSEFTRHVRATYRDGAEHSEHHLVRAVTQPDFLLIDEIKDDLSDSSRRLLTDILMARDNALRPTIITANLTPEELEDALEQRGSDRFRARCMDVVFDGPKYRDTEGSSVAELKKTILLEATREKGMAQA